MLLPLLFHSQANGVLSSRITYNSVAFRFIAGHHHPDPTTISSFRKRFLFEIKSWFKGILLIGKEPGLVKLGNIFIDRTRVQSIASRHKAMSYEHIKKLKDQLEKEIEKLLVVATRQDEQANTVDLDIAEEIKWRKDRLRR